MQTPYTCTWQRYSRSSRLRAAWKTIKELAASEATMNIYLSYILKYNYGYGLDCG